jgi:hypothetical protein
VKPAAVELPPRFYAGRTVRVHSFNRVEVALRLGFGVTVEKNIILEGVQRINVSKELRRTAHHALVVLVGGKNLIVQVNGDDEKDGHVMGRVFLSEKVHGEPEGLVTPHGLDQPLLEVGTFFSWLGTQDFDVKAVKAVLNGKGT